MPKAKRSHAGSRFVLKKDVEPKLEGKWYPADDVPKPRARAFVPGKAKLRKSLTPGTVVILVAGRFKGKRAVFLKQLESGLLLISGAYGCVCTIAESSAPSAPCAPSTRVSASVFWHCRRSVLHQSWRHATSAKILLLRGLPPRRVEASGRHAALARKTLWWICV